MNRIKSLRLENDMSQRALAAKIGCSQKSIDGWEKGLSEPTAGFICALADCFSCTADYLLGREDDFGNVEIVYSSSEIEQRVLKIMSSLPESRQEELIRFAEFLQNK